MDQTTALRGNDRGVAVNALADHIARAVEAAKFDPKPFFHIELGHIFPDYVYQAMLDAMPESADYRPMNGRSKELDLKDGTHTRVKIDLFPEYIRHLPAQKLAVWSVVGAALCSEEVKNAFRKKLAPDSKRFGRICHVSRHVLIDLICDIPLLITPHRHALEGHPVQLHLLRDDAIPTSARSSTSGLPTADAARK